MFSLILVPCFSLCEILVSEMIIFISMMSLNLFFFSWDIPKMMSFSLFLDKMSLYLIIMTLWISSLMIYTLSNYNYSSFKKKGGLFMILLLMMILLVMFSSVKSVLFFSFFEASMIPTMMLILGWGYQPERLEAFFNFFFFTSIPSMPLLIYLLMSHYPAVMITVSPQKFLLDFSFFMVFTVFLVKIPLYFSHFWLPKAHVEAPVAGSMILAGILLKMGGYGLIRFMYFSGWSVIMLLISSVSVLGMILSCFMCLLSPDLKSMIAYSSVSHMNFMVAGLLTNKSSAFLGGLIMMLSHALTSSALFYLCDVMYKRTSSRSLLLNKSAIIVCPKISFWWFFFCILNMAFPFSPGNISELYLGMTLVKFFSFSMMIALMLYFFLSAYYSIFIYYMVNHGSTTLKVIFWPLDLKEMLTLTAMLVPSLLLVFISFTMLM